MNSIYLNKEISNHFTNSPLISLRLKLLMILKLIFVFFTDYEKIFPK